ncbi:MAG: hypothetical protein ACJA1A_001374 [Saprospiraceae bacterium]|jgi:hypothetical protein
MESTKLLNILINLFYYIILITGIMVSGIMIYAGIFDDGVGIVVDNATGIIIDDSYEAHLSLKDYVKIGIALLAMFFFIKSVFHLRIATLKMIHGQMFSPVVARHLKLTGLTMITYKTLSLIREQYSQYVNEGTFTIGLDFSGFESFIFILILGLFFILLSNVIQRGITLQDENALTI